MSPDHMPIVYFTDQSINRLQHSWQEKMARNLRHLTHEVAR